MMSKSTYPCDSFVLLVPWRDLVVPELGGLECVGATEEVTLRANSEAVVHIFVDMDVDLAVHHVYGGAVRWMWIETLLRC